MKDHFKLALCLFVGTVFSNGSGTVTPEGCDENWVFHQHFCYEFNPHAVHFVTAMEVCSDKGASLASVWTQQEMSFITDDLWHTIDRKLLAWVGLRLNIEDKSLKARWQDGSSTDKNIIDTQVLTKHRNEDSLCAALSGNDVVTLIDCNERLPAFVCKKPLKMAYAVYDIFNMTQKPNFSDEQESLLFERVWPPLLQEIPVFLTTVGSNSVSEETDCAHRCFHVYSCRGFVISCVSSWKCNQFSCDLLVPNAS